MKLLVFNQQLTYADRGIVVQVEFTPPTGASFQVDAIVDTGAWISVFDKALAPLLGIPDVRKGTRVRVTPATGKKGYGYVFQYDVVVLRQSLKIPIVFVPTWQPGTPNLLGMHGFLDQFGTVAVEHRAKAFYYG